MTPRSAAAPIGLLLFLASCATGPAVQKAELAKPSPAPPAITITATAAESSLSPGPSIATIAIDPAQAAIARTAFVASCPALTMRDDPSGLTRPADWSAACHAARGGGDAVAFFRDQFETVVVGDGKAFATGYYEPEIAGARVRDAQHQVPIYRRPPDLIDVALGDFSEPLKGKTVRGRVEGAKLVPYHDRTAIEQGALAGRGLELAWAADPVEIFFLQIQGSGRLRLPDGGVMRIGYDSQNGREYTGIGALMRQRGLLEPGQASMQGIMAWIRDHPAEGAALMRENRSFVFFRELTGPGPIGALGIAVTPRTTVAADPKFIPPGAPVWLALDRAEANGLWVAQDTGGAIKGANRVDTFWGAGDEARLIAGGMSGRGAAVLLVPKGTLARIKAAPVDGAAPPRR